MADDVVKREAQHFEAAIPELWKALKDPDQSSWPKAMHRFCDEYVNWLKENPGKTAELQAALKKDGAWAGNQDIDIARRVLEDEFGPLDDRNTITDHMTCTFDKDHVTDVLVYRHGQPNP